MNIAQPNHHQLLRTQVYEYLREELKTERLKSGMFISINNLAEKLGITRTPLRDALLQLQAEGFVTFLPQRGIKINKLSQRDIEDIYEMLGEDENLSYYELSKKHGYDVSRFY